MGGGGEGLETTELALPHEVDSATAISNANAPKVTRPYRSQMQCFIPPLDKR